MATERGVVTHIEVPNLRDVLTGVKEFSPKLATQLRRELRQSGESIIAEQKAILDGPLPPGVEKVGQTRELRQDAKIGNFYIVKKNIYADRDVSSPGRSTGMREGIKKGLVTRVRAGKSRQAISIQAQKKVGHGSNFYQAERFRHPVFGRANEWAYQRGKPYFFAPIFNGQDDMRRRVTDAINDALDQIPSR